MKKNYLKLPQTSIALAAFVFLFVLFFWGCNEADNVAPLYNPVFSNTVVPEIVSVSPSDSAFAGVDEITLTGHNFPTVPTEMAVYFNNVKAEIISADTNKIVVKAPFLVKDTISIKISKFSADKLSNSLPYKLISATIVFKEFPFNDTPYTLTFDKLGNAYVSYTIDSAGTGIKKIAPDGSVTDFAPKGAETYWTCMKFGQSGDLYTARSVKGIFKVAPNAIATTWVTSSNGIGTIVDFDFDQNGNMWAGGNNAAVYRVTQTKNVKPFSFTANIRSVRVFNNYLYVAGLKDGSESIWRFPIINSDSLGTAELYFNYQAAYPSGTIREITFSADGDLYVGTDGVEMIVKIKPDKSSQILFSGVLNPSNKCKFNSFFWSGSDVYMYVIRHSVNLNDAASPPEAIIKVNTLNNLGGAPYYGIQ
ncbi:MAG: IPT/TIG domain-containing protein [Ignavibacteriaceae bacterium]|jgi:hypothetical protein